MPQILLIPRRPGWACFASLLLISIVTGCSPRSEEDPRDLKPLPATPAATDSADVVPQVEPAPLDLPEDIDAVSELAVPEVEPQAEEAEEATDPEPADSDMTEEDPPRTDPSDRFDFGEPLIEGLGKNERLDVKQPIWLTKGGKSVVIQSMVCQTQAPLEMFACLLGSKEHESVLAVPVKAWIVHTGLLATNAIAGKPVSWDPEYTPPTGTEIEIALLWKDEQGQVQKAQAQQWVRDMTTGKAMTHPWVFAGSRLEKDEESRKNLYLADMTGELICVSNFPSATLDVPVASSGSNASLLFEAFTENIPPLGTPVTMVLTPKLKTSSDKPETPDAEQ